MHYTKKHKKSSILQDFYISFMRIKGTVPVTKSAFLLCKCVNLHRFDQGFVQWFVQWFDQGFVLIYGHIIRTYNPDI